MATSTTNYNLKKPAGGDIVDINDINGNMDIIDAELKNRVSHKLATAANQFLVSSAAGQFVIKTIADIKTLLGLGSAAYTNSSAYATAAQGNKADNATTQASFDTHLSDYTLQVPFAVCTGSANTYVVTLSPAPSSLVAGIAVCAKINVANTGASTLNINSLGAKAILDSKGNAMTSGKLRLNGVYTLRYDGTNFILQGEGGSGNAIASDLLSGKTASTDAGDITGSMTNNGSVGTVNLTTEGAVYTIPAGYHNGLGKVKAVISGILASVIKAGTTVGGVVGTFTADATAIASQMLNGITAYVNGSKVTGTMTNRDYAWNAPAKIVGRDGGIYVIPPEGYYAGSQDYAAHGGVDVQDSNFKASNIVNGVPMFGLVGTNTNKRWASGIATISYHSTDIKSFVHADGTINNAHYAFTVSGLTFKPSKIIIRLTNLSDWVIETSYQEGSNLEYPKLVRSLITTVGTASASNHCIKGDVLPASVTSTGFTLPVYARQSGTGYTETNSYYWEAIE